MITPYTDEGKIDYQTLKALIGRTAYTHYDFLCTASFPKCSQLPQNIVHDPHTGSSKLCIYSLHYRHYEYAELVRRAIYADMWRSLLLDTEWYIASGCSGLFAVCQSSEMYFLTEEERLELAEFVATEVAVRLTAFVLPSAQPRAV